MEDFQNLIQDTMNPDQSKLQNATKTITDLRNHYPRDLSQSLLTYCQCSDLQISSQSLVLYRSMLLVSDVPFESYSSPSLRTSFYSLIHPSRPVSYLKKVADILIVLSSIENFEAELLTICMSEWLVSDHKPLKLLSLYILEQNSRSARASASLDQSSILELVWKTLETADEEVKITTCRTVCMILSQIALNNFHLRVLEAVIPVLQQVRHTNVLPALEGINVLVTTWAEVSDTCIEPLVKLMVSLVLDSRQNREVVELAGIILIEIVNEAEEAAFNRKTLLQEVLAAVFHLLFVVDFHSDLQSWLTSDVYDESKLFETGKTLLNAVACLAQEQLFPYLLQILEQMLKSEFWIHQHAALVALGLVAEHCSESFLASFDYFIDLLISFCSSEHPRLRHAALTAVGLVCIAVPSEIKERRSAEVMRALITNLRTESPGKVVVQASKCLVNFCDMLETPDEANLLTVHLNQVLSSQIQQISSESAKTSVLIEVINSLTVIIETSAQFNPLVAALLSKLESTIPITSLDLKLKESCLRCMAYIVELQDFHGETEILSKMLELKAKTTKSDFIYNQVLQVLARCVLKLQFIPGFFNDFVQELLDNASAAVELEFFDNASLASGKKGIIVDRSSCFPCKLALNTEALHNKRWACLILKDLTKGLKSLFLPWSESCFETMKKLLDFDLDSTFKKQSLKVISSLIKISPRLEAERLTFNLFSVIIPLIPKQTKTNFKSCKVLMRGLKKVSVILKDFAFLGLSVAQYLLEVLTGVVSICMEERLNFNLKEDLAEELIECSGDLVVVLIESFNSQFKQLLFGRSSGFFSLIMQNDDTLVSAGVKIFKSYVRTFQEIPETGSEKTIDRLLQLCFATNPSVKELAIGTLIDVLNQVETRVVSHFLPKFAETCNFLLQSEDCKELTFELSQVLNSRLGV